MNKAWTTSPLYRLITNIHRVRNEAQLVVIITSGYLEILIDALVEVHAPSAGRSVYGTKLKRLNELKVLSDHQLRLLSWYKSLRNRAAHSFEFAVTNEDMNVIKTQKLKDPTQFSVLSITILLNVIESHEKEIGEKLFPSVYKFGQLSFLGPVNYHVEIA
jgi:hypothetical protein